MSLRILVVEDNLLSLQLVRDILLHAGHQVVEAGTVDEGERQLRDVAGIDGVLLDIDVPGGGGESLLRKVREDQLWRRLPVIAVTALAMQGDRERLLAAGFDAYVSKPINTREFAGFVEAVFGSRRN